MNTTESLSIAEIHKEIDLLQSCISRMASNSFLVKGWTMTLLSVLIAMLANKTSLLVIALVVLPITFSFWSLDVFFLKTERLYRLKYEWVIQERKKGNREYLYDLNPYNENMRINSKEETSTIKVMFSRTLLLFYGIPIAVASITVLINLVSMLCPS